ncbi:4-coumarate--CoA ligase-like 7 [Formica exsecta]|uniref:4-coumarate--CoA ligase-like 7 n=1 Tax=Formica exsecta TaxID=72781 RepID=UPI0011441FDB|nr:4-coumarate--CoA ligase-like 7 [Formica exsecta]
MGTSNTNDTFYIRDNILIGSQTLNLDDTQNCLNIGYLILTSFMSNPNFIGQVDAKTGEENTFYYMRKRSVKCALWMQDQGIQPNDVIMICTNNQLDAYVPFLAALYIGAVVSPLDPYFIEDNISSVLEQVKPSMLFIDEKFYMIALRSMNELKIPKGMPKTKIIVFSDKDKNPSTKNKNLPTLEVVMNYSDLVRVELFSCVKMTNIKSTAMILFTSGTTASPVHIKIPHVAFMAPPDQHAPNMLKNDTALLFESLCFINGIFITIQAILLHVKVIRIESRFDAETACKIIEKYRVTWAFLETSMCLQLIKSCQLETDDVSSLKTVVFSEIKN